VRYVFDCVSVSLDLFKENQSVAKAKLSEDDVTVLYVNSLTYARKMIETSDSEASIETN
jgi:hypothetical protein